jgi:hypothetical protein
MSEPISYAMRNELATNSFIYFNPPSALKDWSFLAIEAILLIGFILTVVHAIRHSRKSGSPAALYTLIAAFLYGLVMDIISYYTVENFWHGEFTVMFLYNRLPLYIALFYPAFIYHAYMTIRRYDFKPSVEAISVGFFAGLSYLIFDNLGPQLGWWIWDSSDPTTWPYVNSVPLTSYHWFFLFTGAFAFLARKICWDWPAAGKSSTAIYLGIASIPVATIVLGSILFIPYNIFSKNMPPWDMAPWTANFDLAALTHVLAFFAAGLVFLFNFRRPAESRDSVLMLFPLLYLAGHLCIYIAKFEQFYTASPDGLTQDGLAIGNPIAAVVAIIAAAAIVLFSHPLPTHTQR